jgi:RNA polymerase subunit RPABC4/transcription elongation factor Spt4
MRRKFLGTFLLLCVLQAAGAPAAIWAKHRQARAAGGANPAASAGKQTRALWPGSRFTEDDRRRTVLRGLRFIYRTARDRRNFEDYGHDYLWCFYSLSAAVRDPLVRREARRMGLERARFWRSLHRSVPRDADAGLIVNLAFGSDAADSLGVFDPELKRQLLSAATRYTARDYLLFDPRVEPPPADAPDECHRCGAVNERGSTVCYVCHSPLVMRTRYDVWYDALITAYVGERSGINLGARYADVLKWLPTLRPYRARPGDAGEEFHDTAYAVTHVVYTLNNYSQYRLSPRLLPQEFEFLKTNLKAAIADDDADMLGEFMDSLRAFGVTTRDPLMRAGMEYYLTHQNADGSWGDRAEKDIYLRYHPTWNAVAGLSEYNWHKEGLSFPWVRSLLERWAQTESSARFNFSFGKSSPDSKSARMPGGG